MIQLPSPNWQTRIKDELYEKIEKVIERGFPGRSEFLEHVYGLYELTLLKTQHPELAAELEEVNSYTRRINAILLNMSDRIIAQKHLNDRAIEDGQMKTGQAFKQAAESAKIIEQLQEEISSMIKQIKDFEAKERLHNERLNQVREEKELEKEKAVLALRSEFLDEGNKMRLEIEQLKMKLQMYQGMDKREETM